MSVPATKPKSKRKWPKGKAHAQYLLPEDLVKRIRVEAAVCGVWPADIVAERVSESYRRRPAQSSDIASVG